MKSDKLCECGCGEFTNIITRSFTKQGGHKGEPYRFLSGHQIRVKNPMTISDPVTYFWENVDKLGPVHPVLGTRCWLWTGGCLTSGYGRMVFEGKPSRTHRIAWFLTYGKWPYNHACHHCDNPPCVNPDHLFDGSTKDNSVDMVAKNRSTHGEELWCAKLTDAKVVEIRNKRASKEFSARELAKSYGVSTSAINQLVRGDTWRHLG